jgi:hypothetical protein
VAVPLAVYLVSAKTDKHDRVHVSMIDAEKFARACRIYHDRHPDQRYPDKLSDLQNPPASVGHLLDNPNPDFRDAWGNPFRYAVVPNAAGVLEPYVWAEWTRDGKTTMHGAKLAADGTIVRFGLPED